MRISKSLERICDLAEKIEKIAERRGGKPVIKPLIDCREMKTTVCEMINFAMDRLRKKDTQGLNKLNEKDDKVDKLFNQVKNELIALMVKNPSNVDEASEIIFVARYLERAGDIVCNIGSRLIYAFEGERKNIKSSLDKDN